MLDNKPIVNIEIDFTEIVGRIFLDKRRLEISLKTERHNERLFNKVWEVDARTKEIFEKAPYSFTASDWNDLSLHFKAVSIFSGSDIAETIIKTANLPDILSIFVGIRFGNDCTIKTARDLLMFTASSEINFDQCAVHSREEIKLDSQAIYNGVGYPIGAAPDITDPANLDVETNPNKDSSPSFQYPSREFNTEHKDFADVFLYTPINLLEVNFDGVIKPAITASDTGRFAHIFWRYSFTATLKRKVSLDLSSIWPIEFILHAPTAVTGQAGAGIKIGSIRYEAAGCMLDGEVDPVDIAFRLYLDWSRKEIIFESRIKDIKAQNFSFRTFPPLDFPISLILDFLLARVSEFVITSQAGRILKVTRIPIAKLNPFAEFAQISNALAGTSDPDRNVTMGIVLQL